MNIFKKSCRAGLLLFFLLVNAAWPQTPSHTKLIQLVNTTVSQLDVRYGRPIVFEETIETAGYSEIRLFVHVFAENHRGDPMTAQSKLELRFLHPVANGTWNYATHTLSTTVTSYINGYIANDIIGNRVRILCFADNLPTGSLQIGVTAYLVR